MTSVDSAVYNSLCVVALIFIGFLVVKALGNSKPAYFRALHLDGFEKQNIEVGYSFWSWHLEFRINGESIQKAEPEDKIVFQFDDKNQAILTWKYQPLGWDAPQIFLNEKPISWIEKLMPYEVLWFILFPLILAFDSQGFSLLTIPFCLWFNIKIFRAQQHKLAGYILTIAASVVMHFILVIVTFLFF